MTVDVVEGNRCSFHRCAGARRAARWLEERFYEHHDLPGKSSFQRLKFSSLAGTSHARDRFHDAERPTRQFELEDGQWRGSSFVALRLIGLYFEGTVLPWTIGPGTGVLLFWGAVVFLGLLTSAMEEPSGDLTDPNVITYVHPTSVGAVFFIFSVGGLFASDFLQWTQDLAVDLLLGHRHGPWLPLSRLFRLESLPRRKACDPHQPSALSDRNFDGDAVPTSKPAARLEQETVAPPSLTPSRPSTNITPTSGGHLQGLKQEELPTLKTVKETTLTKVPTFREVLMNYWVPLGQPKQNGEFRRGTLPAQRSHRERPRVKANQKRLAQASSVWSIPSRRSSNCNTRSLSPLRRPRPWWRSTRSTPIS